MSRLVRSRKYPENECSHPWSMVREVLCDQESSIVWLNLNFQMANDVCKITTLAVRRQIASISRKTANRENYADDDSSVVHGFRTPAPPLYRYRSRARKRARKRRTVAARHPGLLLVLLRSLFRARPSPVQKPRPESLDVCLRKF